MNGIYALYQGALRNPKTRWIVIVATIIYLISPIDILPDVIPVLGWLDDGVLVSILVMELTRLSRQRKSSKAEEIQFNKKSTPTKD